MGKYTEQQQQHVLHSLSADNRIRATRKLATAPAKNLQSTGHSRWIMEADPNPSAALLIMDVSRVMRRRLCAYVR
jgi:hypothetical protein